MTPVLEERLRLLVEYVREGWLDGEEWAIPGKRTPTGAPPLVIGLARFQSYRARTEAALVQELSDYIEEAGLSYWLHIKILDDSQVIVW